MVSSLTNQPVSLDTYFEMLERDIAQEEPLLSEIEQDQGSDEEEFENTGPSVRQIKKFQHQDDVASIPSRIYALRLGLLKIEKANLHTF